MAVQHSGNMSNQIQFEEHNGELNAKRTSLVSAATIYAVVNTGAGGNTTVEQGDNPWVSSIPSGVTAYQGTTPWVSSILGNITISDSKGFIGLVSVTGSVGINGNVTLSDSKGFIGLVTVGNTINANVSLGASAQFIGIVTVANKDRTISGNITLSDAKTFIGLVSVQGTVGILGNTTVLTRNAGTNKTLKTLPITLSTGSIATIVVPTGLFNITSLLINSNATVRLNIKSGVTYLTGNASLGVNLFPGGGWTQAGSPDSPTQIGLVNAAALVVEKADSGGLIAQIGGSVTFFDE